MTGRVAPALEALLTRIIDYAGMYPPAALPCGEAVANYQIYRRSEHNWMLRWLVVGQAELNQVPLELDGKLAVLSDMDEARAAVIETKQANHGHRPSYCEVAIGDLDEVQRVGGFAKIRTGGLQPEAIPSINQVAKFILACADRRLPFKATAGLHHPVRAMHPLTYAADAPRGVMHGFLNVFMAAAFAWHGERGIELVLAETDAAAFRFDDKAHWRDWSLNQGQIVNVRQQFCHSFGSCSFAEPIQDLEALGLL